MTQYESMMLSVVFGATVGFMLTGVITAVKYGMEALKEKKRNKSKSEK